MHFLSLFSCSKYGFTAGGKKKVPTSFPKIDKRTFFLAFISFFGFYFFWGILFFWGFYLFWEFYFFGGFYCFFGDFIFF